MVMHMLMLIVCGGLRNRECVRPAHAAINVERRIDEISLCFGGTRPGLASVIVDQQHARTDHCKHGESPPSPESRQQTRDTNVLDNPESSKKNRIDLMLASLGVMLEKPSPTQISPRPYFSVTP